MSLISGALPTDRRRKREHDIKLITSHFFDMGGKGGDIMHMIPLKEKSPTPLKYFYVLRRQSINERLQENIWLS